MSKRKKRNGVPADVPAATPGDRPSEEGFADLEDPTQPGAGDDDDDLSVVTTPHDGAVLDSVEAAEAVADSAELAATGWSEPEGADSDRARESEHAQDGQDGDGQGEDITLVEGRGLAPDGDGDGDGAGEARSDDELAAADEGADGQDADVDAGDEIAAPAEADRLESIIMSLLFAADRPLTVADLKRLLGEGDNKRIATALETLRARYAESGVQLAALAGGWQLRTHPANGPWVAKLVAGRPQRLSRALMETLAIVAYRQPITRPEIDEIRGVDCGPVLRTLLDRGLVRVIGKKEEVGRPILYGTTPEFLKTFSLKDLTELPTLREFHELGAAEKAEVDARVGAPGSSAESLPGAEAPMPSIEELPPPDAAEEDALLDELDRAASAANRASRAPLDPAAPSDDEPSANAAGGPESES